MGFWSDVAEALVPSQQSGETPAMYKWRQLVSASLFVTALAIVVTNALVWGIGQPFYQGFAGKEQLGNVEQQVNSIRLDQITRNLRDAKTAECVAQQQNNAIALMFAENEVNSAYQTYIEIAKEAPRIPSCDELVLATPQAPR